MGKSWRERIAEDRANGKVSAASHIAWYAADQCPIGEALVRFGLSHEQPYTREWLAEWTRLNGADMADPAGLSGRFADAMHNLNWRRAEQVLAEIEDRALQFKREVTS
jgi:hypothetical protein